MAPIPNRKALEAMKRVDLQKLCKDYGVKANLKTDALIDLLLDTNNPNPRSIPPQQPRNRTVSTRHSSRTTSGRVSSVVIHDTDDEDEPDQQVSNNEDFENRPDSEHLPTPPPRTRKAKETQKRLGVGRPVIAGGAGARAVTKSQSVSRGKRGKASKSAKPTEEPIPEEEPEESLPLETERAEDAGDRLVGAAQSMEDMDSSGPIKTSVSPEDMDTRIANAIRPLQEQLQSFMGAMGRMQALQTELTELRSQVAEMANLSQTIIALQAEVEDLRSRQTTSAVASASDVSGSGSSSEVNINASQRPPSTPPRKTVSQPRQPLPPEAAQRESFPTTRLMHPGLAPSLLGKRGRESTASDMSGVIEEGQRNGLSDSVLAKQVVRHDKKRARTESGDEPGAEEAMEDDHQPSSPHTPLGAGFKVYTGPEPEDYVDPPPPRTPLPAFYGPDSSPPAEQSGTGQHSPERPPLPLHLNLLAAPTSPNAFGIPSFPYPEPPQSPTPAGPSRQAGLIGGRTDTFRSFGLPPISRPRSMMMDTSGPSNTGAPGSGFVNPAALSPMAEPEATPSDALPAVQDYSAMSATAKRTMYGTELDGESRFGDFGIEGMPSFWTGGRF